MRKSALLRAGISFGLASAIAACAQLQGLDGFEKVDCIGENCVRGTGGPDSSLDGGPTNDVNTSSEAGADGVVACPPESADCGGGACTDLRTSNAHCGQCNNACPPSEICTGSKCEGPVLGNGADGALIVPTDTVINNVRSGNIAATAAQRVVTNVVTAGFAANDIVLLHQTRGTGAGTFELGAIESVDTNAGTITLVRNIKGTYSSAGDVDRAQIVRVPQFTTVSVAGGVGLSAPGWDGASGGILIFKATGSVTVDGVIDMSARGFRGFSHSFVCAGGAPYQCTAENTANGFSGESNANTSSNTFNANGSGGGGAQDGAECGNGGGGGYGSGGVTGANGTATICHVGTQLGGGGGLVAGDADLTVALLFGGAGGEGGADEDGAYPGRGGNGGGIIWIDANVVTVNGTVRSNGETGADGVTNDGACGGANAGMGPGGGGAGGAIHLRTVTMSTLGASLVTANGGGGGTCGGGGSNGGGGGDGRIGVAGAATGTTTPAFVPK